MSLLQSISQDYLIAFDSEGNSLYKAMRIAEDEWIAATGFQHFDLENRTHLLVATSTKLPSIENMRQTRSDFRDYLFERAQQIREAGAIDFPDTLGVQSTSLPVWLLPDRKAPVDSEISRADLDVVRSIKIRRQVAWRSTLLRKPQVMAYLEQSLQKAQWAIESAKKNRQYKRVKDAEWRSTNIRRERAEIQELFEKYGDSLTARLKSGYATKILLKSDVRAWTASIANVALVLGDKHTTMAENVRTRMRNPDLVAVAEIGRFIFFIRPEKA